MNKQKEVFEAWYSDKYSAYALKTWNADDECYSNLDTELAWQAWQAAIKAQEDNGLLWQPVSRPPEKHVEVLVWPCPSDYCMTAIYDGDGWSYAEYEPNWGLNHITCFPTHWMSLPQEPNK